MDTKIFKINSREEAMWSQFAAAALQGTTSCIGYPANPEQVGNMADRMLEEWKKRLRDG